MAAPVILLEAQPRRVNDGVAQTVRLAGGGAAKPYRYLDEHWRAGITGLPTVITSLDFSGGAPGSGGVPSAAEVEWAAANAADLAQIAGYMWLDAPVAVRIGPEGAAPPIVLAGTVLEAVVDGGRLRIALADPAAALKKPLLSARFAGTGGLEGPAEWDGLIRSRVWGRVWNQPGDPIDKANNVYCFGDPLRPLQEILTVRDRGAAGAALAVLGWQGDAAATFAALQAAVPPQGGGVACPSIACVKWWTHPAGALTADIRGENSGGYIETAAEIAAHLVAAIGGPAFAAGAVAGAAALRPAAVGWVARDESTTVAAMLDQLLGDVSLLWVLSPVGEIVLREWAWGASAAQVRAISVSRERTFRPVAGRKIGYRRNELPMARGDLAAILLATDLEYLDGTPIEDLKPAEPGATEGATLPTDAPGNIVNETGNPYSGGDLRNDAVELTDNGMLAYRPVPSGALIPLGQVTPRGIEAAEEWALERTNTLLSRVSEQALLNTLRTDGLASLIRDAGITVDPASGTVQVYALEYAERQFTDLSVSLDAQAGSIALQTETLEVLGGSVDGIDLRLAGAETTLTALGDVASITDTVRVAAITARRADDNHADVLEAILADEDHHQLSITMIGEAHQELTAQIVDGLAVEAAYRIALTAQVGTNNAAITAEQVARAAADTVLTQSIVLLQASTTTIAASVQTETTARIAGDNALAASITGLQATDATLSAGLLAEQSARIDGDDVTSADVRVLRAVADAVAGSALEAILAADDAAATGQAAAAQVSSELTAQIIAGDSAVASDVTTLTTTVAGHTTTLTSHASSIDGISARWGVSIDINGRVTGRVQLDGNATTSTFDVLADKFRVYNGSTDAPVFEVSGGQTYIKNAVIHTGGIGTSKIAAGAVSAPNTTSGSDTYVSAGATSAVITTGWLTIGDATDGSAYVMAFGEIDTGTTKDAAGRINLYIDTGGGFVQRATSAAGARTVGGDTYLKAAILASATVAGAAEIRVKLEVVSIAMPGASAQSFTFRSPQVVVMGARR